MVINLAWGGMLFALLAIVPAACGSLATAEPISTPVQTPELLPNTVAEQTTASLSGTRDHLNEGVRLAKRGRVKKAIAEFDEALRRDPELALGYYNRGLAYFNLGQPQRAIEDLEEAMRIDPQFASAYAARARIYTMLQSDELAQQDIDRAVELGLDRSELDAEIKELKKQRKFVIGATV